MTAESGAAAGQPEQLSLRAMRWWDVEPVAALDRSLFPTSAWTPEQFWSELAGVPESRWYVVAESGDDVVGYGGVFVVPPEADVQTLAVAREAQGRGLGRRLLDALVEHAVDRGCTTLMLEVNAGNRAAQQLYAAAGFETIARRSRYYPDGSDALILQRRLHREPADG